ncbi:hypothetical protein IHE51_01990 [Candidatus Parvarchaeota archaeon]|uniref:Uncharacterized protein n=1 Tax=Candidatus Acidifodinimicrobium mancum TaxID=2898728 RepID=A0A8T3UU14_9ARCH|nr:hypothetical protein [Candidatus Acidifodinimicrobium mancum]MBE5728608.1 hypothetical protein [Candidatus Acidifodinimicrobium mancum]MBE5728800.1 hypothetical protein [Candidatus Acidifodinimicrobium mancum]MBE5730154.1 hypothetical protein [Candidatus Acidifodinimicrobium mancum]
MVEIHKKLHDIAIKLSVYSSILDFGLMLSAILVGYKVFPKQLSYTLLFVFTNAITYVTLMIVAFFLLAFVIKYRSKIINIDITTRKQILPAFSRGKFAPIQVRKVKVYTVQNVVSSNSQPAKVMNVPSAADNKIQYVKNKDELFVNLNGTWLAAERDKFLKVKKPYVESQ